jgi:hypothetical protein
MKQELLRKVKRYIPELVYQKIKQSDFKNKDHLYIICDMIGRMKVYIKNDDYSNSYIDIPKQYFRDLICDVTYLSNAMTFLLSNQIIITDNQYVINEKAKGYKINDIYISKLISVYVESTSISKRIAIKRNERNNSVNDKYKIYKNHFINTFKIHYNEALLFIETNYLTPLPIYSYVEGFSKDIIKSIEKYNRYFLSISMINDGDLFFRVNKTNGRIDTNLTNLKSELKQFITTKNLHQIDISNSQPFILGLVLSNPSPTYSYVEGFSKELERYMDWTSLGVFYENFQKAYYQKNKEVLKMNRKQIKEVMFCIFYSKNEHYKNEKKIFGDIFPNILNYIIERKRKKYNELAIHMQKIESEICIDIICQELDKQNIKYYTIHDSWLVDEKDIPKTKDIISNCFNTKYNHIPNLKTEKIS